MCLAVLNLPHRNEKRSHKVHLLDEVMKYKGIKASELSRLSGISETTISKVRNGADVRLTTMVALFDAMGLELTYKKK